MVALRAVNPLYLQTAAVLTEVPDGCAACSDHAMALVTQHIPKPTHRDKHQALQTAAKHLLSRGTSLCCTTCYVLKYGYQY